MNKARREKLKTTLEKVEELWDELDDVLTQEEEKFDSLSESVQEGLRGERMAAEIESLESAMIGLQQAKDELEAIIDGECGP